MSDKGLQTDNETISTPNFYQEGIFMTGNNTQFDNYESLKRRKIPIKSQDENAEILSTDENMVLRPVDNMQKLIKQKEIEERNIHKVF